jgi:hypothetical protein
LARVVKSSSGSLFHFFKSKPALPLLALWLCGRLFLLFGCVFASQTPLTKKPLPGQGQEAAEKIKRENDVHLRQLAKKVRTYLLFFLFLECVFGRFSARGVRKHEKRNLVRFKKKSPGKYFFGGGIFFLVIFF